MRDVDVVASALHLQHLPCTYVHARVGTAGVHVASRPCAHAVSLIVHRARGSGAN